ncbi:MAG: c-type cytochrome, methanol metabolism-related [Rhodobacteraceae bacterium]|nr:MAG: c-type cytochrome, methanol metabolism-related [Paracoccaceae bacterium]
MTLAKIAGLAACLAVGAPALATAGATPHEAVTEEDGKFFNAEEMPTFMVLEDGTVDWYTFSGFRRYHAECHVCHGPDGQGSSYAPGLASSVMRLDYFEFVGIVASGYEKGNSVMPAFGTNRNVMCYVDDLYVYLRAVGSGAIPRGRPANRMDKPESAIAFENDCMG